MSEPTISGSGPEHAAAIPVESEVDPERSSHRAEGDHPSGLDRRGRVQGTRISAWWSGVIVAAALGVLFLIFITQNSEQVTVHFLWFEGQLSLAVALLLSAITGVLLVAVPGVARIVQLRRALRKNASKSDRT